MPQTDRVQRLKTTASGSKVYIGVRIAAIVLAVAVLILAFYVSFFWDGWAVVPAVFRITAFTIYALIPGGIIYVMLVSIRRERRRLALMRAEDPRIECSPSGLAFTSRSRSHTYDWAGFRAVLTDRDYLSFGPIPNWNLTSLLLLDGRTPKRPSLSLRLALGKATRRATFFPVTVDGITVIPMKYFDGPNIHRLVEDVAEWHRRAVG